MIMATKPISKCIVPGCTAMSGKTRGVCQNCYQATKRAIDRHLTTWEELQDAKLILPPHQKRVEDSTLFVALVKVRESKAGESKRPTKAKK